MHQLSKTIKINSYKLEGRGSYYSKKDKMEEEKIKTAFFWILSLFIFLYFFLKQESVEVQPSQPTKPLGFSNQTGSNITQAHLNTFISLVNLASTYYRDDTKTRLDYISDQMSAIHKMTNGFSVIQLGNESHDGFNVYISKQLFATVGAGVDKVFPHHSYMFNYQLINSGRRVYFSKVGQKGSGIDATLQTVISNTIMAVETNRTCQCTGITSLIKDYLEKYETRYWNIICGSSALFFSLNVYVRNEKYIYIRPKNCYYAIYES